MIMQTQARAVARSVLTQVRNVASDSDSISTVAYCALTQMLGPHVQHVVSDSDSISGHCKLFADTSVIYCRLRLRLHPSHAVKS